MSRTTVESVETFGSLLITVSVSLYSLADEDEEAQAGGSGRGGAEVMAQSNRALQSTLDSLRTCAHLLGRFTDWNLVEYLLCYGY